MREVGGNRFAASECIWSDRICACRVKRAIERFADTGAGSVKKLQGIDPPEYRLRVGDFRVRFHQHGETIRVLRIANRKEAYR